MDQGYLVAPYHSPATLAGRNNESHTRGVITYISISDIISSFYWSARIRVTRVSQGVDKAQI